MKRNVALFGKAASGKTTIATVLAETGYLRMSFATPLKNVAALAYGTIGKGEWYDVKQGDEMVSLSGRGVLQQIGQAVKEVDQEFWLKAFLRDAGRHGDKQVVLDDGRFEFERDALRGRGFLIVGVNTPQAVRHYRYEMLYGRKPTAEEEGHASESQIDRILQESDVIVQGTDDPYANVRRILEKMEKMNRGD